MPMRAKSSWLAIEGGLLVILGVLAFVLPIFAGIALSLVFGWILLISGAMGLASALRAGEAHRGMSLVSAAISLIIGALVLWWPVAGALGLTLFMSAYLFLDGVTFIFLALDQNRRGTEPWAWLVAAGLADVFLGVLVFVYAAVAAPLVLGLILGMDLVIAGAALIAISLAVGKEGETAHAS